MSDGSVVTNRVKGRPAFFKRGQAFSYTDRNASSIVIATVRFASFSPFSIAAMISGNAITLYFPLVSSAICASNSANFTLLDGLLSSPKRW